MPTWVQATPGQEHAAVEALPVHPSCLPHCACMSAMAGTWMGDSSCVGGVTGPAGQAKEEVMMMLSKQLGWARTAVAAVAVSEHATEMLLFLAIPPQPWLMEPWP